MILVICSWKRRIKISDSLKPPLRISASSTPAYFKPVNSCSLSSSKLNPTETNCSSSTRVSTPPSMKPASCWL